MYAIVSATPHFSPLSPLTIVPPPSQLSPVPPHLSPIPAQPQQPYPTSVQYDASHAQPCPTLPLFTNAPPYPGGGSDSSSPVLPCMYSADQHSPTSPGYCDSSYPQHIPYVVYTMCSMLPQCAGDDQDVKEGDHDSDRDLLAVCDGEENFECGVNKGYVGYLISPGAPFPYPTHHTSCLASGTHKKMGEIKNYKINEEDENEEEEKKTEAKEWEEETDKVPSFPHGHTPLLTPSSDSLGVFGSDGCWYPLPQSSQSPIQLCSPVALNNSSEWTHDLSQTCPQHREIIPDTLSSAPSEPPNIPQCTLSGSESQDLSIYSSYHLGKVDWIPSVSPQRPGPKGLPHAALPYHKNADCIPKFSVPLQRPPLKNWEPQCTPALYNPRQGATDPCRYPFMQKRLLPGPEGQEVRPETVPLLPYYNYYHHLDLPEHTLGRPRLLQSIPRFGQTSVLEVWLRHMEVLFRNLPDMWFISAVAPGKEPTAPCWRVFKDLAKVRFYCRGCCDGWTSMYGVVVFRYYLDRAKHQGNVVYQVAGQKCRLCQKTEVTEVKDFQLPLWYPEEAQKVITNLYYNVATNCYGLVTPQYIRTRRMGKPVTHHDRLLCQGCREGVCKMIKEE
ncbi:hypothetical protein Pcinc_028896 [Petrolisthes cinctipes]|uniref:3CxxC-type domain-containing protein n=1 Tax=Petrolisthes cinctipes TaxID=88211 RepID=A0AAE1F1Y9_PETCI|nr:hypothetical protein Pcinc_028896 [Petrolisthes cinctipes]